MYGLVLSEGCGGGNSLEEKLSEWVECLTESMRADYRKAFGEIKEGKIPIIRECDYVAY